MNDSIVPNPFRENVVQDAWQTPTDVAEIHDDVFRACLTGIESAARGVPDSLLIYGPAGSGKTHLLTRLQRHLAETREDAPDQVLHCVFVFVRLQTTPSLLWQHVRKRLTSDLMRRDQGVSQLQRLVAHQMRFGERASPRARVMGLRVLSEADQGTLIAHLAQVAESLNLPRDLCIVLEHLVCARHIRDASAWLAGESLPDEVLSTLGIGPDIVEDREAAARETVTALCRLAGETLPIVFCFDQVEALQRGLDDRDAFFRFGRTAADLCDADPNVFVITCLQSSYLDTFKACIRGADQDRMARREALLQSLSQPQIQQLLATRLLQLPVHQQVEAPSRVILSKAYVAELSRDLPYVARRVLATAARTYDELRVGHPSRQVDTLQFLRQAFEERSDAAAHESSPADTERILVQGLEAVSILYEIRSHVPEPKTADFVLEGERRIAVEICNEADGRSLGPRLKRILANTPRSDGARTVILRDPRLPIAKSAIKTKDYLKALRTKGVALLEPTVEALAALAALSDLLANAKSGDLTNDGAAVSEQTVVEWLRSIRGELLVEPIVELVDAINGDQPQSLDGLCEDLAELLSRKRILEVDVACAHLDVSRGRLVEIAMSFADRFLLLEGPPEVVIDVAGIVTGSEILA